MRCISQAYDEVLMTLSVNLMLLSLFFLNNITLLWMYYSTTLSCFTVFYLLPIT